MPTATGLTCDQFYINNATTSDTVADNIAAFLKDNPVQVAAFMDALYYNIQQQDYSNGHFAQFIDSLVLDTAILMNDDYSRLLTPYFITAIGQADPMPFYGFFDSWANGRALLDRANSGEDLLEAVYKADPAQFLTSYITASGNDATILTQSLSSIPRLNPQLFTGNLYRVSPDSCWTSAVVDSIVHTTYYNALASRRLSLSSHILYGSSRLGTKDYIPGQFYELYSYTPTGTIADTLTLSAHRSWYSLEYNDAIAGLALEPYNATDVSSFYATHQIGMKQYELNNHLGNVQATITDLPYPQVASDSSITGHSPAMASAYDYYPFGMLMPDRYVSDTSSKCVTATVTKWVTQTVDSCYSLINWVWPYYEVVNGATATQVTKPNAIQLDCSRVSSSVSFKFSAVPQVSQTLSIGISDLTSGTGQILVEEEHAGNWTTLTSTNVNKKGLFTLTYQPTVSQIRVRFLGPYIINIGSICVHKPVQVQQSYLADICSGYKDRYRFGFNGQEKVNEWSGLGNHNTAQFWEYDTRTGRRLNLDPKTNPSWSAYSAFGGNPILYNDPLGDTLRFRGYKYPLVAKYSYEAAEKTWEKMKQFLRDKGLDDELNDLENSPYVHDVYFLTGSDMPEFKDRVNMRTGELNGQPTLYINPNYSMQMLNGYYMSPIEVTFHEMGHTFLFDMIRQMVGINGFINFMKQPGAGVYQNNSDKWVITGMEQRAAKRIGFEFKQFGVTRTDHIHARKSYIFSNSWKPLNEKEATVGENEPPKVKVGEESNGGQKVILQTGDGSNPVYDSR